MRYHDKTTGRDVELRPSMTQFLVVTNPEETEGVHPVLAKRSFAVRPSTNADGIFILQTRNDAESAVEINRQLEDVRRDPRVRSVAPGLVDADTGKTRFVLPDRVVVQFRTFDDWQVVALATRLGARIARRFRGRLYEFEVPAGLSVPELIDQLNHVDDVIFAEPNFYGVDEQELAPRIRVSRSRPYAHDAERTDETARLPWNLETIEASVAWQWTRGRPDVVVAVVDGMPELDHEALAEKLLTPGDDSLTFSSDRSVASHATNVASTIVGESGRMVGVAPGIRVVPVVVNLSSQTYAERADALRAVAELARRKTVGPAAFSRVVMSCSWRTSGDSAVVRTALEEVVAAGVLTVFSAGNEDNSLPHFPSDYGSWDGLLGRGVVSVAATDRDDRKAAYSNYSPRVNVSAPGGDGLPLDARDILCADQGNSYVYAAGTSIAAPHVAAVAALMLSIDPNLSAEELKNLIVGTADELPATDTSYRNLRLNAGNAIIAARRTAEDAKPDDTPSDDTPVNDRPDTEPKGPAVNVPQVMPAHTALVILETLRVTSDQLQAATGWSLIEGRLTNGSSEITIAVTETDTP